MLEKLCELCCTYESDDDIQILLDNIQSSIPSVRESCILVSFPNESSSICLIVIQKIGHTIA
jgi:hypothetical protein